MLENRVNIINTQLASMLGKNVFLGDSFLFLDWTMENNVLSEHLRTAPKEERVILSRWGIEEITVAGYRVNGQPFPDIPITAVISDKLIYTERDMVSLLVIYLNKANESVEISVRCNGEHYTQAPLMLNESGVGIYRLANLPIGNYEVSLHGTEVQTTFEVAEYQLQPLVSQLRRYSIEGNQLSFEVVLTSFDVPYFGEVTAQLQVDNQNAGAPITLRTDAEGKAQGVLTLPNTEGMVTINLGGVEGWREERRGNELNP